MSIEETTLTDELELGVQLLFEGVLGVRPIDTQKNFFELGGHSLSFIKLCSRIRHTFQVELNLDDLARAGTCRGIAACVRAERHKTLALQAIDAERAKVPTRGVAGPACMDQSDESLGAELLLGELRKRPAALEWHDALHVEITGELDYKALARAIHGVAASHPFRLEVAVVSSELELAALQEETWHTPFTPQENPLRITLAASGTSTHVLMCGHARVPRGSLRSLFRLAWQAFRAGGSFESPITSGVLPGVERGPVASARWCELAPEPSRATRPPSSRAAEHRGQLGEVAQQAVVAAARRNGCSAATVLFSAFGSVLRRRSNATELRLLAELPDSWLAAPAAEVTLFSPRTLVQVPVRMPSQAAPLDDHVAATLAGMRQRRITSWAEVLGELARTAEAKDGLPPAPPLFRVISAAPFHDRGNVLQEHCVPSRELPGVLWLDVFDASEPLVYRAGYRQSAFSPQFLRAWAADVEQVVLGVAPLEQPG